MSFRFWYSRYVYTAPTNPMSSTTTMMMTVKMTMLNWVHDTSAKAEVLFSAELPEKTVCGAVGVKVLFMTGLGTDVAKEALGTKMVEPSGVGTVTSENENRE